MRSAELLGLPVVGPDGEDLGHVLDIRLAQDGPLIGTSAALRIEGFVVGRHHIASRLGYDRVSDQGPWMVARAVRWWTRNNRYLPWEQADLDGGRLVSRTASLGDLPQMP